MPRPAHPSQHRGQSQQRARPQPGVNEPASYPPQQEDQGMGVIKFGMEAVTKLAEEILPHCNNKETRQEMVARLTDVHKQLMKTYIVHGNIEGIVQGVARENQPDSGANSTTILKTCDAIGRESVAKVDAFYDELGEDQIVTNHLHVQYLSKLQETLDAVAESAENSQLNEMETDEEEEEGEQDETQCFDVDEVTTQQITTKDPISLKMIKHPVQNKHCKHIYDRITIMDYIKKSSRANCPVQGCPIKGLRITDIQEDAELTRKVLKKQREQMKGKR